MDNRDVLSDLLTATCIALVAVAIAFIIANLRTVCHG